METHKPLLKDADGEDVDEHMYRSMIGSLMYLTSSRLDIMFAQTVVANSTTETEYIVASKCCRQVLWIQNLMLDYTDSNKKKLIQMIKIHTDQNVADLLTKAFDRIIHKGWLEWNAKVAKDGIGVKTENVDFAKIVDFLNANPIRYALTVSPTIYVSCIEQFWSTAKTKIVNNETRIHAKVEGKTIVISESSVRKDLQFDDEDDETVTKEREEIMERAATTASSLEAYGPRCQDTIFRDAKAQTRFETASKQSNNPPLSRVNTLGSREDRLKLKELMDLYTKLSNRVLDLETTKTAQAKEIASLKKRVKKMERKRKSKTLGMNLFKIDMDEVFKDVKGDAEQVISATVDEVPTGDAVNTAGTKVNTTSALVTTIGVSVSTAEPITAASVNITTAEPITPPTTTTTTFFENEDLTIAQTLVKMRSEKSNVKGVVMQEPSETATRPTVPPQQHDLKDKGKAQMQAELKEEERLAKEREEDANIAEWDNVQAMMDVDYMIASRLQAQEQEELTIEKRSKMFVELMDKRKKHFTRLRAKEQRRKPLTKAQKRNQMCTYLKNMAGFTYNQLKKKSFDEVQKAFDKTISWIDSFVPMDSKVVKGSKDRAEGSETRAKGSSDGPNKLNGSLQPIKDDSQDV
ncbi:hypothetical protein Tco_0608494 [Tanacetum coccineum]